MTVIDEKMFQYRISMEGNYSSCTIGVCMVLRRDSCWYRNKESAICNSKTSKCKYDNNILVLILAGDEYNVEQVSSSLMPTTTPSLMSALVSVTPPYSLQTSYSSASLSRESTLPSLHLPVLSSGGEAAVTNYESCEQL